MVTRPTPALSLTKWYLDCVASDGGDVAIAYWASLAWGQLSLTWHALTLYSLTCPPVQRSSVRACPPPRQCDGRIAWDARPIGCVVEAACAQAPLGAILHETESGVVDWMCAAPAATITMRVDGARSVSGTGYIERLSLTLPPWQLPIDELRWGRWHDASAMTSLVWIDWRGPAPRRWVWLDGEAAPRSDVTDLAVTTDRARLSLGESRTLHDRRVGDVLARIPPLAAATPPSVLAWRDTRWLSAGTLERPNRAPTPGRAIHERVVFR